MTQRRKILVSFLLLSSSLFAGNQRCRFIIKPELLPWDINVAGYGVHEHNRMLALEEAQKDLRSEIKFCESVCKHYGGDFRSKEWAVNPEFDCRRDTQFPRYYRCNIGGTSYCENPTEEIME